MPLPVIKGHFLGKSIMNEELLYRSTKKSTKNLPFDERVETNVMSGQMCTQVSPTIQVRVVDAEKVQVEDQAVRRHCQTQSGCLPAGVTEA